jgi:hypothetical protein
MTQTEWQKIPEKSKVESRGGGGLLSMDGWALVSKKWKIKVSC